MNEQAWTLIGVAAVALIVIGGLAFLSQRYSLDNIKSKTVGDGQFGTARWATKKEIHEAYTFVPFQPELWRAGKDLPTEQGLVVGCVGGKPPKRSKKRKKPAKPSKLSILLNKVMPKKKEKDKPAKQKKAKSKQSKKKKSIFPQKVKSKQKQEPQKQRNPIRAIVDTDDIHALVTAASGAGKTAFFLYPNIEYALASGMSFLCTDTKGDLFRNYAGIARDKYGFNIAILDLRNPTRSDGDNLLHLINKYMDIYKADPTNLAAKAKAEKYAKILAKTLINTSDSDTTLDLAIESVEKAADFYSNLLIRKLGLEGNIDRLDDTIAKYKTYLGLLEDPITWKSGDYGKDLKMISLEIVEELEELEQTRKQIDEFKKTLKSFKADLALTEKSIHLANLERPNLHKYLPAFQFMNSGAGKVLSFAVLDLYGILVSAIGVVDAIDVARARENTIENAQDRADRMLAYSNAAAKCTGMTPPDACEEAYDEYIVEGEDAKDWNTAWFRTKVGQAIGSVALVAAGAFIKGVPGIVASVGIGLVGGAAEWACLAGFNDSIDDMQEIWLEVETNCMKEYELSDEEQECVAEELSHGSEDEDGESGAGNLPDGNDGNNGEEKPEYPIGTKPQIDPAGYVYEAVASNRIDGATAKIYYEGESGEEIYWADADLYGEVNPQITDVEGRFAWMTPIGNWLVKITKDGYENADSKNDPAAENGWLPVPPPQLDVNIAMVSEAAPEVTSAAVAADQAQVVFSQYMDVAQFAGGELVTVAQNGEPIAVTAVFTDAEVSPTDADTYYGRVLKLTRTDGQPFSGSGIEIMVSAEAENYAGNTLENAYVSGALTAAQIAGSLSHSYPNRYVTDISQTEEITVQVLDTAGQPMAGVTVTARQKLGGTMNITESAVSDASGRAVFTVKGISSGYDTVIFEAGILRTEMNTRVSPLGSTAPQKPTANLSHYAAVEEGTQLILTYPGTEDVVIYYTTNNTCPCTDSAGRKVYTDPITITEDTYFRIAAWTQTGGYSERLNLHITVKAEDVHICKDHLTRVEAKPADCTVDGNVEYYECACGKYFADAAASVEITDKDSVVVKASHDYGTLVDEVPAVHTATELKAGIPCFEDSPEWSITRIRSILQNEKYCGDVLMQKTFRQDFISRKTIKNTGQLPMYLIENHHDGIVDRDKFNKVQTEMARRSAARSPSQKAPTGLTSYASKYALSERLVCGECGTLYRRCTWTQKGEKRIVWRCVSRLDYGKKYCHNSPTLDEAPLQQAILTAITTMMASKETLIQQITGSLKTEVIPFPGGGLSLGDIDRRLAELEAQFQKLLKQATNDPAAYSGQFKEILDEQTYLKEKRTAILAESRHNAEINQKIMDAAELLDRDALTITEWDESVIRQMVETVKVLSKNEIVVTLKGGAEINQRME